MSYEQGEEGWQTVPNQRHHSRGHHDEGEHGENQHTWQATRRSQAPHTASNAQGEDWPALSSQQQTSSKHEPQQAWQPHPHSQQQHQLTEGLKENFKKPANQQHFAEHVDSRVNIQPTEEELRDVAQACSRLWELDINRLTPGQDYEIDCGEGRKVYERGSGSRNALFRHLDPNVFRRPTYARFYALLDNYNSDEGVCEIKTYAEQQEEVAFIEEISRTAPVKYLQAYLAAKGIFRGRDEEFKEMLQSLWFKFYDRDGTDDSSSAFEHVFVGEIKSGRGRGEKEVSGLHNWIQFYLEEANGNLDYEGFILPRRRGDCLPDAHSQLLSVQFRWKGLLKPVSSTLIGVSPEFELVLYTLCYYAGQVDNFVTLGPYDVNIKVYPFGRNSIGSAYPIAIE